MPSKKHLQTNKKIPIIGSMLTLLLTNIIYTGILTIVPVSCQQQSIKNLKYLQQEHHYSSSQNNQRMLQQTTDPNQNNDQEQIDVQLVINGMPVTGQSIQKHTKEWVDLYNKIMEKLAQSNKNITTFIIDSNTVDSQGIETIFNNRQFGIPALPNVEKFIIRNTKVNEQIMKTLFAQNRLYQIKHIQFVENNLFCQDLSYLQYKQTKIEYLIIKENPVSTRGFQYLTRLKMNLSYLSLTGTSLIDDQAVDAVISWGLQNIENIQLCNTGISGQNVIKILNNLNLKRLNRFSICENSFPVSFYVEFAKFQFSNLKILNLQNLNIDEDGFQAMINMKFPKLQILFLENNQLNNKIGQKFINKKNMPILNKIDMSYNYINTTFFQHLAKEKYVFKAIVCHIRKMNPNGLQYLSLLDLSNLNAFSYGARVSTPQAMIQFVKALNEKQLKNLLFSDNLKGIGNYFNEIVKKRWQKLQSLYLNVEIQQISPKIYERGVIFPQLTTLSIAIQSTSPDKQKMIVQLIKNIQKIAPKLEVLQIDAVLLSLPMRMFIKGTVYKSLTVPLKVILNQAQNQLIGGQTFVIKLFPQQQNQKPKIISIGMTNTFLNCLFAEGYQLQSLDNFQDIDLSDLFDIFSLISNFQDYLFRNFDWSQLQILKQSILLNFVTRILKQNGGNYQFTQLRQFHFPAINNLQFMRNLSFPMLQVLVMQGNQQSTLQQAKISPMLNNKFKSILQFTTDLEIDKQVLIKFIKGNNLQYLLVLDLMNIENLHPEDLQRIHESLPYLSRIRHIKYDQAYINNDLTFLAKTGIRPQSLILHNIVFNPGVIKQLCPLNFEFIKQLKIQNSGMDDRSMIQFIQCLESKIYEGINKTRTVHFPTLVSAEFSKNYIGRAGIRKFMSTKMPVLGQVLFDENSDSQTFNSMFYSLWSGKLYVFVSTQKKFDSIDSSLNSRNTGRLKKIVVDNAKLYDTDILALSKLDFNSLQTLAFVFSKVQNCKFLQNLLKITKNVIDITIVIEQSPKLNSTCLQQSLILKNEQSWVQPQQLTVLRNQYYGQITYFVKQLLGKSSNWKQINIQNVILTQQIQIQLLQSSSTQDLKNVVFDSCGINDRFLIELTKKQIQNAQKLVFINNPITEVGLELWKDEKKEFKNLQVLVFKKTSIGDKGLQYISACQFQNLILLDLQNCDITKQGLVHLNQLYAPNLSMLILSNNGLTAEDILQIDFSRFQNLQILYLFPSLTSQEIQEIGDHVTQNRGKNALGISIPFSIGTTVNQQEIKNQKMKQDEIYAYFGGPDDDQQIDNGEELTN